MTYFLVFWGLKSVAIFKDLRLASRMGFSHIMILSDSLTMIKILQGGSEPLIEVTNQVADIRNILHVFWTVTSTFVPRKQNSLAHALAGDGFLGSRLLWLSLFSPELEFLFTSASKLGFSWFVCFCCFKKTCIRF